MTNELRKELISYYKWIVTIATFILTILLGFISFKETAFKWRWAAITGGSLLGICIFTNWILVKKLVTLPIIKDKWPDLTNYWLKGLNCYGTIQNSVFLLGIIFITIFIFRNII